MAAIAKDERGTLPGGGSWVTYSIRGKPRCKVIVSGTPKEGFYIGYSSPGKETLVFGWNKSRVKAEAEARKWIQETKADDMYEDAYETSAVFALHHEG